LENSVYGKEKGRKGREHELRPALSVSSPARGEKRRGEKRRSPSVCYSTFPAPCPVPLTTISSPFFLSFSSRRISMPATEGSMLRRKVSRQSPFYSSTSIGILHLLQLDYLSSGQLEARERLLGEMESKARERVEAAEIESYRLKGRGGEKCSDCSLITSLLNSVRVTRIIRSLISPTTISFICFSSFLLYVLSFMLLGLLVHMEHVASALRGQGGEETERLRQEHHRLQVMQVTVVFPCPPSLPSMTSIRCSI
jgi:hypothetical protein